MRGTTAGTHRTPSGADAHSLANAQVDSGGVQVAVDVSSDLGRHPRGLLHHVRHVGGKVGVEVPIAEVRRLDKRLREETGRQPAAVGDEHGSASVQPLVRHARVLVALRVQYDPRGSAKPLEHLLLRHLVMEHHRQLPGARRLHRPLLHNQAVDLAEHMHRVSCQHLGVDITQKRVEPLARQVPRDVQQRLVLLPADAGVELRCGGEADRLQEGLVPYHFVEAEDIAAIERVQRADRKVDLVRQPVRPRGPQEPLHEGKLLPAGSTGNRGRSVAPVQPDRIRRRGARSE
mmetsp:Transcript_37711/g.96477  ORF Transcript_37711/g.96477 Transcript_37711/m.96477 type:complete len:289 (-) Transcript_37711:460-1326(-)